MNAKIQRCSACRTAARQQQGGLSTLEFLGCLVAVLGGAWIGALYLGADMQQIAHSALAEADLLDKVPAKWRPQGKVQPAQKQSEDTQDEFNSLRTEVASLRGGESDASDPASSASSDTDAKQKTLAYWQRLNELVLTELALQQETQLALNEDNASKVFAIKGRASKLTAKELAAMPTEQVEPSVVQFSEQLENWYSRSGDIYEQAVEIWERPETDRSRESMSKDWHAKELQHRNEARLLHERATRVRNLMGRQFGEQFPAFAKPAEAAPSPSPTSESSSPEASKTPTNTESPAGDNGLPASENGLEKHKSEDIQTKTAAD